MNQEFFHSFPIYQNTNMPLANGGYEELTKHLMMKLSLQNFLINFLTLDSFNDLMLIHRKIDEMLHNLLFRQQPNGFFQVPPTNFPIEMPPNPVFFFKFSIIIFPIRLQKSEIEEELQTKKF